MVDSTGIDACFQFLFHVEFVHGVGIEQSFFTDMKGYDDSSPRMGGQQRSFNVVHCFDVDGIDDTIDLNAGATLCPACLLDVFFVGPL